MSDASDTSVGPQSQMLKQAQAQGNDQRSSQIGMNGTTDLGNNTTVSGGVGEGGDLAGSAAGATEGSDMQQEQPGYGSNPVEDGKQADADMDENDDMGDGASAASAAGGGAA